MFPGMVSRCRSQKTGADPGCLSAEAYPLPQEHQNLLPIPLLPGDTHSGKSTPMHACIFARPANTPDIMLQKSDSSRTGMSANSNRTASKLPPAHRVSCVPPAGTISRPRRTPLTLSGRGGACPARDRSPARTGRSLRLSIQGEDRQTRSPLPAWVRSRDPPDSALFDQPSAARAEETICLQRQDGREKSGHLRKNRVLRQRS